MLRHSFAAALIACLIVISTAVDAADEDFFGIWDVNTRLTAASSAINPDYEVGDLRTDVWRIAGSPENSLLTTKDGTIPGQIGNGQAQYLADVPLGEIIVMRISVGAFLTSSRSMKGTISAEYWDRRFGYKVGLDAWTFEAFRR